MSIFLKQKKLFRSKEFELTGKSLKIKTSKPFDHIENEIGLEQITDKFVKIKNPNVVFILITLGTFACIVITMISHFFDTKGSDWFTIMFYVTLFILSIFLSFVTYENNLNITLKNGLVIGFFNNLPSTDEMENFLSHLKEKRKALLLESYAKSSEYLSQEQISNNLYWLWHNYIIDDAELHDLRLKLLPKPGKSSSMGFKSGSSPN